jgi:hypothetical protein
MVSLIIGILEPRRGDDSDGVRVTSGLFWSAPFWYSTNSLLPGCRVLPSRVAGLPGWCRGGAGVVPGWCRGGAGVPGRCRVLPGAAG